MHPLFGTVCCLSLDIEWYERKLLPQGRLFDKYEGPNNVFLHNMLSFELGWLTPGEGLKIIEKSLENGLLIRENNELIPLFEYKKEKIPLGYTFNVKKLDYRKTENLLSKLISCMAKESPAEESKIIDNIEKTANSLCIYHEAAALLIAKKSGINITTLIEEVRKFIKNS